MDRVLQTTFWIMILSAEISNTVGRHVRGKARYKTGRSQFRLTLSFSESEKNHSRLLNYRCCWLRRENLNLWYYVLKTNVFFWKCVVENWDTVLYPSYKMQPSLSSTLRHTHNLEGNISHRYMKKWGSIKLHERTNQRLLQVQ